MENTRFKFRVWDKTHDEYLTSYMISILLYSGHKDKFHTEFDCFTTFADSLTIEQCTGLRDKNGNLIYEGDKVEITTFGSIGPNGGYVDSDEIHKGTVVWDRDCFLVKTDTCIFLFPHSEDCIEIVGNIHEIKGE